MNFSLYYFLRYNNLKIICETVWDISDITDNLSSVLYITEKFAVAWDQLDIVIAIITSKSGIPNDSSVHLSSTTP